MADARGMGGNNAVNSDLADLHGARFVYTSEVDKDQRLSLGRVKYLTGITEIRMRRLRENWITFPPTHKLFMDCNDRPAISSPTDAVWNRLVCVPFDVVIPTKTLTLICCKSSTPNSPASWPGLWMARSTTTVTV